MTKRISTNWFKAKSQQQTYSHMATIPVIAKTGTRLEADNSNRREDDEGNAIFIVGESIVGEEEIV